MIMRASSWKVLGALLPLCSGAVFQLDSASPYVTSNAQLVRWSRGYDAFLVASSSCVRVNHRGVYTKPAHWSVRALDQHGWVTFPSTPDPDALASYARGRIFPSESPEFNPVILQQFSLRPCTNANTGRHLTSSAR